MTKIYIVGKDIEYCKALAKSIVSIANDIIVTFLEENKFNILDNKIKLESIIIFEGNISIEKENFLFINLSENRKNTNDNNDIFQIYKYDNVNEIIRGIYLLDAKISGNSYIKTYNRKTRLISVYSGGGGYGKTTVALGLAQEFSRFRDKKALYINFEFWDSSKKYLNYQDQDIRKSLEAMLYYINKDKNINIKAFIHKDSNSIFHFQSYNGLNPLRTLNKNELSYFFEKVVLFETFDYIFIDCSSSMDENTNWLLNESDRIVFLREIAIGKIENLTYRDFDILNYIKKKSISDTYNKIINVINLKDKIDLNVNEDDIIIIEKENFVENDGIIKINIEGIFGRGINKLADKIEQFN